MVLTVTLGHGRLVWSGPGKRIRGCRGVQACVNPKGHARGSMAIGLMLTASNFLHSDGAKTREDIFLLARSSFE